MPKPASFIALSMSIDQSKWYLAYSMHRGSQEAVEIQAFLRQHVPATDLPSLTLLTRALKALHFPHGAIHGSRGWYVLRKT